MTSYKRKGRLRTVHGSSYDFLFNFKGSENNNGIIKISKRLGLQVFNVLHKKKTTQITKLICVVKKITKFKSRGHILIELNLF